MCNWNWDNRLNFNVWALNLHWKSYKRFLHRDKVVSKCQLSIFFCSLHQRTNERTIWKRQKTVGSHMWKKEKVKDHLKWMRGKKTGTRCSDHDCKNRQPGWKSLWIETLSTQIKKLVHIEAVTRTFF